MNMTRKEEIREAASSYRINDGEGVRGWEEAAFEAGARWADKHPESPWIKVRDKSDLPSPIDIETEEDLKKIQWHLCHGKEEGSVHSWFVGYYAVSIASWEEEEITAWCNIEGQEVAGPLDVDYYMPIPELPKEENNNKTNCL